MVQCKRSDNQIQFNTQYKYTIVRNDVKRMLRQEKKRFCCTKNLQPNENPKAGSVLRPLQKANIGFRYINDLPEHVISQMYLFPDDKKLMKKG